MAKSAGGGGRAGRAGGGGVAQMVPGKYRILGVKKNLVQRSLALRSRINEGDAGFAGREMTTRTRNKAVNKLAVLEGHLNRVDKIEDRHARSPIVRDRVRLIKPSRPTRGWDPNR